MASKVVVHTARSKFTNKNPYLPPPVLQNILTIGSGKTWSTKHVRFTCIFYWFFIYLAMQKQTKLFEASPGPASVGRKAGQDEEVLEIRKHTHNWRKPSKLHWDWVAFFVPNLAHSLHSCFPQENLFFELINSASLTEHATPALISFFKSPTHPPSPRTPPHPPPIKIPLFSREFGRSLSKKSG